ncbi:MAG: peptidase M64 [Bacteroidales bacterium]|nr:peptidase M64 [Bacteroidales bacterium]
MVCSAVTVCAQRFDDKFADRTLRVDYIFSGDADSQQISVDELRSSEGWYGRRANLGDLLLRGNGQVVMTDTLAQDTLYRTAFSTLFQEWQCTEEATKVRKSFENVFLLPMPKDVVDVTVTLTDTYGKECARLTHRVNPNDILIRPVAAGAKWEYIQKGGDSRGCIDFTFVPEGYTEEEMPLFLEDCRESVQAILGHEPFKSMAEKLNFVAVLTPTAESGVSIPHEKLWRNTVLNSNFDTFYSQRYLTTLHLKDLHDLLSGVPYEHILILANTKNYGGGGIFNSYLMTAAHNEMCRPVLVHELGHSFAGLGDEYYDSSTSYEEFYNLKIEPWEPNITTLVNFESKWKNMLPAGTAIPTAPLNDLKDNVTVGVYEGGGYMAKGIYRPVMDCRMKTNQAHAFCPVCQRAIEQMIEYYCK